MLPQCGLALYRKRPRPSSTAEYKYGDEVCIAYLPEDGLLSPTVFRRHELHQTKHFWCTCERCDAPEDATRGVFCPKNDCKGTVFSMATDPEGNKKEYLESAWRDRKCNLCGHTLTEKQSKDMADNENRLKKIVDDGVDKGRSTRYQLLQTERWMEETFSQHFLVDNAWEQLSDCYLKQCQFRDQRRVLELRCEFFKQAYPGLSGSHAWSLEALGDTLRIAAPTANQLAAAKKRGRSSVTPIAAEREKALQSYTESIRILRLMFGEDHEYVVSVVDKMKELEQNGTDAAV